MQKLESAAIPKLTIRVSVYSEALIMLLGDDKEYDIRTRLGSTRAVTAEIVSQIFEIQENCENVPFSRDAKYPPRDISMKWEPIYYDC